MALHRVLAAVTAAVALSLAVSGVVVADVTYGRIGHYSFTDGNPTAGAWCRYALGGGGTAWVMWRIRVPAPSVWWPDTNPDVTTQHGPVGWRFYVKRWTGSEWVVQKKTAIQHATAYEDQLVPYGSSTKAPFKQGGTDVNGGAWPANTRFMVTVKVYWFRRDGTVRGWVTHDVQHYGVLEGSTNRGTNAFPYCYSWYHVA
jgi:hypothetical protein